MEVALNQTNRSGKITALLMLDGDNFKKINDTYAHDGGDAVIEAFANRIQKNVRPIDTVSRMGGDEFQVVLPDLKDKREATTICQAILDAMKLPIESEGKKLTISASIGISYYFGNEKTKEELAREADKALYFSKKQGKSAYTEFVDEQVKSKKKLFDLFFR